MGFKCVQNLISFFVVGFEKSKKVEKQEYQVQSVFSSEAMFFFLSQIIQSSIQVSFLDIISKVDCRIRVFCFFPPSLL